MADNLLGKIFGLNEGQKMAIESINKQLLDIGMLIAHLSRDMRNLHEEQWKTLRQYFPELEGYHLGYDHKKGQIYIIRLKEDGEDE